MIGDGQQDKVPLKAGPPLSPSASPPSKPAPLMGRDEMYWLFENDKPAVEFGDTLALAVWLIRHPETHDYERINSTCRLRFREPWRLEKVGV